MELKIFRDTLPQGGAGCTIKAELPLETEIRISDDLPPVGKLVKCFVRPVVLQRQLQPGRLILEGYLRCTVFYQSEAEKGLCQTEQKLPFTRQLELPELAFTAWTAVVEGQTEYLNSRAADPRRIEVRGAYGLVVTVHTQCKTEVITALAEGGLEQQLRTLQGVRSVAVLDKLVTLEGELVFAKPPAAVLDITGNACVAEVKLLAGKLVNSYLLNGFPGLLGGSVVVVLVLVRGPPDGVFGILVLNDELILGGTSGVDTGHNVHGAQLTDLSFFIALK